MNKPQGTYRDAVRRPAGSAARGFTLIELLVVVVIGLILTGITVATINITINRDSVRSGARQIQSYLEGARDRAIKAREPRGVRFILDPTNSRVAASMVYISQPDPHTEGTVLLERPDGDNDGNPARGDAGDPLNVAPYNTADNLVWVLRGFDGDGSQYTVDTGWKRLYERGLIRDGARIQIPYGTGAWYTIDTRLLELADDTDNDPPVRLLLQQEYREVADTDAATVQAFSRANAALKYKLELAPAQLPGIEPTGLPQGVVIHFDRCSSYPDDPPTGAGPSLPRTRGNRLPDSWKRTIPRPNNWEPDFAYGPFCDLMFSPRGSVTGSEASLGMIHLYVADKLDADRDHVDWSINPLPLPNGATHWSAPEMLPGNTASDPTTPYQRRDKTVVSIFTRTGAITTNPIYVNPDETDNLAERFRYSETGEVAGR